VILLNRKILIISDIALAGVAVLMGCAQGGFEQKPLMLKLLLVAAFASCIIRHINYYKVTKKIY
jgi:hypothetical protein